MLMVSYSVGVEVGSVGSGTSYFNETTIISDYQVHMRLITCESHGFRG